MAGIEGQQASPSGAQRGDQRQLAYLILGGLAVLFCVIVIVAVTSVTGTDEPASAAGEPGKKTRDLPVYWTVRRGETYIRIARKTGLTVEDLETFNPKVDPASIRPGQRLKLRKNVPKAKKRVGPKWVTLRSGDSFGSVAAKTGRSITRLQQLNPKLKPSKLQPGDRMRLR